ncbi:hypothetical protein [Streptomyces sp. IMTB 2501]|nr:hypothetical protein [Streptomyces sp. IMTB 2501]
MTTNRRPRLCLSSDDIAAICEVLDMQGDELVYVLDDGQEIVLTPVECD